MGNDMFTQAATFFSFAGNPTSAQSWSAIGFCSATLGSAGRVAGFLRDLGWPAGSFMRELHVMFFELKFKKIEQRCAGHVDSLRRLIISEVLAARPSFIDRASVEAGKVRCWYESGGLVLGASPYCVIIWKLESKYADIFVLFVARSA